MGSSKSLEERMDEFVAQLGDVPPDARKLQDYEARHHRDIWIQRLLGEGIACHYVVGYQLEDRWWTFCFDRRDDELTSDEEHWVVEGYDSYGSSWRAAFCYDPSRSVWRRAPEQESLNPDLLGRSFEHHKRG